MPGLLPPKVGHTLHNKKNKITSKTALVIQYMLRKEQFRSQGRYNREYAMHMKAKVM